jgi:CheY-like chemotaxis protein
MSYKHILLIDDDIDDLEIFATVLRSLNFPIACTPFSDAEKALSKLEAGEVPADIIVTDLNMPYMSGQELMRELKRRERWKDTPVVVLSASGDAELMRESRELGAIAFIIKPSTYSELRRKLKALLFSGEDFPKL